MDPDEYRRLAEATESHWWFAATSRLIENMLSPHLDRLNGDAVCLDAGGGTGATSSWLAGRYSTALCEIEPIALGAAVARYPRYLATVADINHLPFRDDTFAAAMCVTALCHEMNDRPGDVVRELARVIMPGGCALLLEPNHPWLWRGHDRITHTARRFTLRSLGRLATDAGLVVERATGAFTFLVPAAAALKVLEGAKSNSDVGRYESGLGGLASRLASVERRLIRYVDLPFGLSAVVLAVKPS